MQHKGKVLKMGEWRVQPLTTDLEDHIESIINDLEYLFSNEQVVRFNKNVLLNTYADAKQFFYRVLNGYDEETYQWYFLLNNTTNEVAGAINLIAPKSVRAEFKHIPFFCAKDPSEHHKIWMVEYYLHPDYWGQGLMWRFVSLLVDELFHQGASYVAALSEQSNVGSNSALKKLKFVKNEHYQDYQHQKLWIKTPPGTTFTPPDYLGTLS